MELRQRAIDAVRALLDALGINEPAHIIGHSMGAAAVSKVQGTDKRVATVVATAPRELVVPAPVRS